MKQRAMNQGEARQAMRWREPFKASALSGETVGRGVRSFGTGRASRAITDAMQDSWSAGSLDYVVYSYGTPIAWHDSATGWHIPADKYSVTTSKHQGIVRRALVGEEVAK